MSLSAGTRLGPYEILSALGKGGMGEVYRAHDTRLHRDVAVKVSAERFSERFEREARAIAALNHPNICQIYDVGPNYLVMELVEGENLKGPVPLATAVKYASQIAEALEAAHEKGIVHRDLKPANIKITPAGVVKILDFGLAKSADEFTGTPGSNPTLSPTLSLAMTQAGMILGTAAYMSPEQARGHPVDRRSDIWAFGVVLFEMLAGKQLFRGGTVSDILAGVLKEKPDMTPIPAELRPVLERCLQKDPSKRLRDIGDLDLLLAASGTEAPPQVTARAASLLPWAVAALFLAAAAVLGFVHLREKPRVQQIFRFQISPPGAAAAQNFTLSPDGNYLAFVAAEGGQMDRLWVRAMDTLEARALAGTDGATYPFWSPGGDYLGFFAQGKLKKIALAGGPAQTLCDAASGRGGTWNRDGLIVFSPGPTSPLLRVSSAGGAPVTVTKVAGV